MIEIFTTPCTPDIHAMPAAVQRAGSVIRAEIQRLYSAARQGALATEHGSRHPNSINHPHLLAIEREAWAQYDDLCEAYHAWAGTVRRETPFRADPALLARIVAGARAS